MANDMAEPSDLGAGAIVQGRVIRPSFRNALPHFLPLAIFPLVINAAIHGGWWIACPLAFYWVAGMFEARFGDDELNMDPERTPEDGLFWYKLAVWTWAVLWLATLVFSLWQILVAGHLSAWETGLMALVLGSVAQSVFIVGHEMIHRLSVWERRFGEFLLSSVSYPHYVTEHIYIHHAPGRYARGHRIRAQGPELLELLPAGGGKQPHRSVAGPAGPAGAPPPVRVALHQSVLALLHRMRVLVRVDLVDGRGMGSRDIRRPVPRRGSSR